MTLFIALSEIKEKQDPSLQFDFVCRAGICGSCGMLIDGRPTLACRTLTKNLGTEITLAPLPFFELIGDLSVNTGKWMRGMSERLEGWLHAKEPDRDLKRLEERMDPAVADRIYELDRCVECGCCVASCGTARPRLLRGRRRRRRRVRLHVAARLPRRVPEGAAARHADRLRASQDGRHRLEEVAAPRTSSRRPAPCGAGAAWLRRGPSRLGCPRAAHSGVHARGGPSHPDRGMTPQLPLPISSPCLRPLRWVNARSRPATDNSCHPQR